MQTYPKTHIEVEDSLQKEIKLTEENARLKAERDDALRSKRWAEEGYFMNEDLNKKFCLLAGICWHDCTDDIPSNVCQKCGWKVGSRKAPKNPDFSDAREVLKVLMPLPLWEEFQNQYFIAQAPGTCYIRVDYIIEPGKLRDSAITWMEANP
jgi:hypothetical protein